MIDDIVKERGEIYGHPYNDFGKVVRMVGPIQESNIEPRLKHALYMVQVKIARLLQTQDHQDSIDDIYGYMKTYEMVLERLKSQMKVNVNLDTRKDKDEIHLPVPSDYKK